MIMLAASCFSWYIFIVLLNKHPAGKYCLGLFVFVHHPCPLQIFIFYVFYIWLFSFRVIWSRMWESLCSFEGGSKEICDNIVIWGWSAAHNCLNEGVLKRIHIIDQHSNFVYLWSSQCCLFIINTYHLLWNCCKGLVDYVKLVFETVLPTQKLTVEILLLSAVSFWLWYIYGNKLHYTNI